MIKSFLRRKLGYFSLVFIAIIVPMVVFAVTYNVQYFAGSGGNISGNTNQSVEEGQYAEQVTAEPLGCHDFMYWTDTMTSENPRQDGPVYSDINATAVFVEDNNTYNLEYIANTGGTISGNTLQTLGCEQTGEEVTAVPDSGYVFVNWEEDLSMSPSRSDNVGRDNKTFTANFVRQYILTYTGDANCSISGDAEQEVNENQSGSTVEAQPGSGWYFVKWSDDVLEAQRTDTATSDLNVSAICDMLPERTVTYNAGSGGSLEGVSPQTVSQGGDTSAVTAVPDPGNRFVIWSDGYGSNPRTDVNVSEDITVTALFSFEPGITLSKSSVNVTENGSNDSYTVVLDGMPSDLVTINFSTTNQATTSVSSLSFTDQNWDTPQSVTVSATSDFVAEGNHYATTTFSVTSVDAGYNDFTVDDMSINITDNDTVGFTKSKNTISINEGSNDTFTLVLDSQPSSNVVLDVASNNTSVGVSVSEVTFNNSNWSTPQTITVTGVSDDDFDNETASITISVNTEDSDDDFDNISNEVISVNVTDDDTEDVEDEEDSNDSDNIEDTDTSSNETRSGSRRRSSSVNQNQNNNFLIENQQNPQEGAIEFFNEDESVDEKLQKCEPYLNSLISYNKENNSEEVVKLKKFLNSYLSLDLELNDVYNEDTINAVKKLKLIHTDKFKGEVFENEEEVGFVTKNLINSIICGQSYNVDCPYFSKTDYAREGDSGQNVTKIKRFLNNVEGEILDIKSLIFDKSLVEAVKRFQLKYYESILKPWGIVAPTGIWYQSTTKTANDLLGCFDSVKIDNGSIIY